MLIKFENKTNGRFYYVSVVRDLFADTVVVCRFGGRNSYRHRTYYQKNENKLKQFLSKLSLKRLSRGYEIVT